MLNQDLKKRAFSELNAANQEYQKVAAQVTKQAEELHRLRVNTSKQVIEASEAYINTLSNSPKEFDKSVAEFKIEYKKFTQVIRDIETQAKEKANLGNSGAGAGIVAGVGVAALGPTAAMAIATTFGTASTGTAIATLSGAAATNAALAWLGGGALAAGGSGMAGGQVLLAMTGPIGWTIGGLALAGSAVWMDSENKKSAQKAFEEAARIRGEIAKLKTVGQEVSNLIGLTRQHADGVLEQLLTLKQNAPSDYRQFSQALKNELATLINNIRSLSQLLNKKMS
ncbi:hypothetical protein [Leptolyngbya sp. FACHB-261]|uniref:hypothetical protein n=1 Tax=Leptolyngbya sp. FACHB-261 TaxID=2692806 RepID=UPI001685B5B2|nr:hypothetical protein [Leptolyngbya sp. FACHB-261]MBD2100260.1 hypothetical protein [Leptolyngbya sp. FACHB-261]